MRIQRLITPERMHDARLFWDSHKKWYNLGFQSYDLTEDELKSPEYRGALNHVYDHFSTYLNLAAASDIADIGLKRRSLSKLNTWIDYSLLNALNLADYQYCNPNGKPSVTNFYTPETSVKRELQFLAVGSIENLDTSLLQPLRRLPGIVRVVGQYLPVKTLMTAGVILERADERYESLYKNYGLPE